MKNKIIAMVMVSVMIVSLVCPIYAYGKKGHNELIEEVLFGNKNYSDTISGKEQERLVILEYATMICLDQYNNAYETELEYLRESNIHNLPESIKDIDFEGNQYHRKYTHKGWDFDYNPSDKANWLIRKEILLQSVNTVFGFCRRAGEWKILWRTKNYGYDEKCVSFSAFLYYLHILGEYEEVAEQITDSNNTRTDFTALTASVIPLARAHPSDDNADVFWELEKHLPVIFESQKKKGSNVYTGMMTDISILATKARSLAAEEGGITVNNFEEYCGYAMELIDVLKNRIPKLLEREKFFNKKFG